VLARAHAREHAVPARVQGDACSGRGAAWALAPGYAGMGTRA
jgi:hypothetical protein